MKCAAGYGFEYDASSRLTRAYGTGLDQGFSYDKNGKRTSFAESGVNYPYACVEGTNRLLSVDGPAAKHYAYDAVGNILSDGVHAYGYDARNSLTRLNDGQFTYRINAQGLRVCKESLSESAVYFTYEEGGQLIGGVSMIALIEPVKIAVMEPLKKLQKRFRTTLSNQVLFASFF